MRGRGLLVLLSCSWQKPLIDLEPHVNTVSNPIFHTALCIVLLRVHKVPYSPCKTLQQKLHDLPRGRNSPFVDSGGRTDTSVSPERDRRASESPGGRFSAVLWS